MCVCVCVCVGGGGGGGGGGGLRGLKPPKLMSMYRQNTSSHVVKVACKDLDITADIIERYQN